MSGGSWDYLTFKVDEAAARLDDSRDPLRRAFGQHLHKVAKALHDIEWNDSGDGSPDEPGSLRACLQPGDELAVVVAEARDCEARLHDLPVSIEEG